ncbi:hypothetical protein CCACVL1_13565 [Corchorus capsularis]|uniref:Uncharacterized protein n=1 Tax=Corchorus capsularis TaxID=210143 RepID=A0A1R3IAF8_COCAP|nr:hypothetical protein CCACVL1_13565 [Corchorus capsularis]
MAKRRFQIHRLEERLQSKGKTGNRKVWRMEEKSRTPRKTDFQNLPVTPLLYIIPPPCLLCLSS